MPSTSTRSTIMQPSTFLTTGFYPSWQHGTKIKLYFPYLNQYFWYLSVVKTLDMQLCIWSKPLVVPACVLQWNIQKLKKKNWKLKIELRLRKKSFSILSHPWWLSSGAILDSFLGFLSWQYGTRSEDISANDWGSTKTQNVRRNKREALFPTNYHLFSVFSC